MHRHLRFELPDPLAGHGELGLLRGRQPGLQAAVDAVLAAPVVDRLVTDPEIVRDLGHLAAGLDQIQHPPTELRPVATLPHAVLLQDSSIRVQSRDSTKARADQLEAPAFRDDHLGSGLAEWAAANRVHDRIELPVINAALLAAALHEKCGNPTDAIRVLDQALKVCPTNEALTRAAMVLEAKAGDREAALRRYHALATVLARDELEPEPDTSELRKKIMTTDQ